MTVNIYAKYKGMLSVFFSSLLNSFIYEIWMEAAYYLSGRICSIAQTKFLSSPDKLASFLIITGSAGGKFLFYAIF